MYTNKMIYMWEQYCCSFSHDLIPLLKLLKLFSIFSSVGRLFQSLAPVTEKADRPKDVLHIGIRQLPLTEARVFARLKF